MKQKILILAWLLASVPVFAGPLPKECISADAKWLLHLDAAEFKAAEIGKTVAKEYIEPNWAQASAAIKMAVEVDLDWQDLQSLTVFGTEAKPDDRAVVLIQVEKAARQKLEKAIHEKAQASKDAEGTIQEEESPAGPIFKIAGSHFATAAKDTLIVLSKNRTALEKTVAVINGKSPNLNASNNFAGFSEDPKGMFFIILAEGFYTPDQLPPQAQIFRQAEGGKVVLGEKGENLYVSLSLKAKTTEACTQMQQVLQGLQALVTLSKNDDPEIMGLINSIKIASHDKIVSVSLEYSAQQALSKLTELADKKHKHKEKRKKS
jgi:hypothetical protein